MKIKLDKDFFKVIGIAALCSLVITMVLLILSLISWMGVFAVLMLLFMPLAQGALKFYKEKDCMCLEDFFAELMEPDNESISKIEW